MCKKFLGEKMSLKDTEGDEAGVGEESLRPGAVLTAVKGGKGRIRTFTRRQCC